MNDAGIRQNLVEALNRVNDDVTPQLAARLLDPTCDLPIAELGISSLEAVAWCLEIETLTGVEVGAAELPSVGSINKLADLIARRRLGGGAKAMPQLVQAPRDAPPPLSPLQEPIWAHSQTAAPSVDYTMFMLDKFIGPLDVTLLRDCLSYIVKRHEILRTTFTVKDGQPVQIVHPPEDVTLPVFDVSTKTNPSEAVLTIAASEKSQVDLSRLPSMRFSLVHVSDEEHWLLRVCHHLIWEDWSDRVLRNELALLYEAKREGKPLPLPETQTLHYADYAVWQRQVFRRDGSAYQEALAWWKNLFQPAPRVSDLPFKRSAPITGVDPREGRIKWPVDAMLAQRIARLAEEQGVPILTVWLGALAALLQSETGASDVLLGTYMTARRRPELQDMLGFFANQVALRFQCGTKMPFSSWLAAVDQLLKEAERRCDIPYVEILNELARSGVVLTVPLVFFAPLDYGVHDKHFADLKLVRQRLEVPRPMPSHCWIKLLEYDKLQECLIAFDAGIYDPAAVRRFMSRLLEFLDAASRDPDASPEELLDAAQTREDALA